MLLVDTNVLVDVVQNDPQWADWSIAQMRAQSSLHALVINPVIYAEMSLCFSTLEALDDVVSTLALELRELPRPALFLAAKAYSQYRRRGGHKRQVLPDFFVGAHAAVQGWPLLTRDANRFRTYFPTLEVISPGGAPQHSRDADAKDSTLASRLPKGRSLASRLAAYTDAISHRETTMSITTVFTNNRSQAVRLPADVRLPDGVKKVNVRARGAERIISPVGRTWDEFFLNGPQVSSDFLAERATQPQAEREAL